MNAYGPKPTPQVISSETKRLNELAAQDAAQHLKTMESLCDQLKRAVLDEPDAAKALDRESDLYKQYVEKFTAQEAEFDKLRAETADLRARETAKRQEIADYLTGLRLE